ncbi:MAG: anthranilate synthase component I family protein [Candidatus Thermoplasmatota archaeon]|nr:anthranilate synthase component I family protein [Candidatus Thermoplasmatota archaeon]
MATEITEALEKLVHQGKNFAYFCKFTDEDRIMGEETLITGKDILTGDNTSILKNIQDETPVILSFSLVNSIFKARAKEGLFPPVMMLIPESKVNGFFKRPLKESHSPMGNHSPDKEMEKCIKEARERIRSGEALQIVISREFGPFAMDPLERVTSFLANDRSLYVFYFKFGKFEIFGSSPENLVTREKDSLMIEPIAGTRKVSSSEVENEEIEKDLLSDPKELLEHRMLVDLARNDLGKISEYGSVHVTRSMQARRFASVMHIVSQVRSTLKKGIENDAIINSVFPAGTVSGAPKDRAIRIINELETTPRGPYAGSVGLIGRDKMDLALAIRTVYGNGNGYYVRSGAGIVKDSDPEKEVNEIRMKSYSAVGGMLNEDIVN